MVYGTGKLVLGTAGLGKKTPGGHGIFGGYPPDLQQNKYVFNSNIREWFRESRSPTTFEELDLLTGDIVFPPSSFFAIPVKEFDVLLFRWGAGGGYGDPLDRAPEAVLQDVKMNALSLDTAEKVYGVVIDPGEMAVAAEATRRRQESIRAARLALRKDQPRKINRVDIKSRIMRCCER